MVLLLILFAPVGYAQEYFLSACAVFQNEARFLDEWISYHYEKGVEHFWLYNNNSTDNYREVLAPWIEEGIVELIEWPSKHRTNDVVHFTYTIQTNAYNDALKRAAHRSLWMAIIDTDEFIVPVSHTTIPDVLEAYFTEPSAVYINWMMYGTSNVERCPDGKMLSTLTMRAEETFFMNQQCKSIVRVADVQRCANPHYCDLKRGYYVDGHGEPLPTVINPQGFAISRLRIHHYWCRDREFMYNHKIPRYLRWGHQADGVIERESEMNAIYDPKIAR